MELLQESFKDYQARDGFNQSTIKRILDNPHLWALGIDNQKSTSAMDFGSLCHDLILSPCEIGEKYHIERKIDKFDFRKKEHKDIRDKHLDKILIDGGTYIKALELYKANMKTLDMWLKDDEGLNEVTVINKMDGLQCKARLDYYNSANYGIIDLKIVADASKNGFMDAVAKFGYYIQAAFYLDITNATNMFFIAIEKEPPYMLGIYELAPEAIDLGREKIKKAFDIIANKQDYESNQYFEYLNDKKVAIQTITLPTYAFYKD